MREGSESVHSLTMANEDYLEAILRIKLDQHGDGEVRSVDVAEKLGVSKASVNKALSALKDRGLVRQAPYGKVELTEKGEECAAYVWRCHRILKEFLETDLGVDTETADHEACLMEHALSQDTMDKWMTYLEGQGLVLDGE